MLPIPTRSVFRNRWWSLAWAAGICWTAVEIAGSFGAKAPANQVDGNGTDAAPDAAADQGRAQMDALVNSVL